MKAWRFVGPNRCAEQHEIPTPVPAAGEVLVKIGGAGVCHSDLHILSTGREGGASTFTLGHENAGWVAALGEGATGVHEGDAVAVYGCWGCGQCRACMTSFENYCTGRDITKPALFGGAGLDGGMAEYMIVPSTRHLLSLGSLTPWQAAPLTDAALTPYHAIRRAQAKFLPGDTVSVIGIGGLGHMAVQLLRALTACHVLAIDIDAKKLDFARSLGAHATFNSAIQDKEELNALLANKRCSVVLDCVGSAQSMELAIKIAGLDSQVMVLGLAGGEVPFCKRSIGWGVTLSFPFWGSRSELYEVLRLAESGAINPSIELHPMKEAAAVLSELNQGGIRGRAVLVPD